MPNSTAERMIDPFTKPLAELVWLQQKYEFLNEMNMLVWAQTKSMLVLLIADYGVVEQKNILECALCKNIKFIFSEYNTFLRRLAQVAIYNLVNIADPELWAASLLRNTILIAASDIHLEVLNNKLGIRVRADGVLLKIPGSCKVNCKHAFNHLKILANCDIAESRRPQDGRFRFKARGVESDFRFNSCPTINGEKIVLRILDKNKSIESLAALGMDLSMYSSFKNDLQQTSGLIIATGPTGSGKTSTLYSALKYLNDSARNIITIENPVEYTLDGVNQIAVDNITSMDFNSALRASLRQDPDIILVGEIRDSETAITAVEAALTGHLVLTTLHTRNAWQAIIRLKQLGISEDLIANSLRAVIAQRLCRTICTRCHGRSCEHCNAGYLGRVGVFEYLPLCDNISRHLLDKTPLPENFVKAFSFKHDIERKLASGIVDAAEIDRVFGAGFVS
jgi:general secretion pathway protein E